jgi:hypothetical protein
MSINPLTLLIQLQSSKHPAYCPNWERKKNALHVRSRHEVRLKVVENKAQTTLKRTNENTRVEISAKTNTAYVMRMVNSLAQSE